SPNRVFDAWLDPAMAAKWLFAPHERELARVEIDARVGGRFDLVDHRDGEDISHSGTYLEIDRPNRLSFTLFAPKYSPNTTRVTISIMALDSGCELLLVAELTPDLAAVRKDLEDGWREIFDELAIALQDSQSGTA
ncbi:MAG TPA: SRPBCC family protein, partial [Devosiaceae bacterium]|nr:SRPBCC family protein [Devosiaceae bacterium]